MITLRDPDGSVNTRWDTPRARLDATLGDLDAYAARAGDDVLVGASDVLLSWMLDDQIERSARARRAVHSPRLGRYIDDFAGNHLP